jgi:hypothetical protein
MATTIPICACCGQKVRKLNPHSMDKQKVRMLEILGKNGGWMKLTEGATAIGRHGITVTPYRARAHASRLVWFGLAEHSGRRTGLYRITPDGYSFLIGAHAVPNIIYCKDGLVVERGTSAVSINDIKGVILDTAYWDNYASLQKEAA